MIRSPLRYPGGKARFTEFLISLLPPGSMPFLYYREPMVGGGSLFLAIRQLYPQVQCWINDIDDDLVAFWTAVRDQPDQLIEDLIALKKNAGADGKALYETLLAQPAQGLRRASKYFMLNRSTFSGVGQAGGFSQRAFEERFTTRSILKLKEVSPLLQGVRITQGDYESVVNESGFSVLIYVDPPYYANKASKLYGSKGEYHTKFDHDRLCNVLRSTRHMVLLSYDDCEWVRQQYSDWYISAWTPKYSMANAKNTPAKRGRELALRNYARTFAGFVLDAE